MADNALKGTVVSVLNNSTYDPIGQVQSIGTVGGKLGKRDVTHLGSTTKEYRVTLLDPSEVVVTVIAATTDVGLDLAQERVNTPSTGYDSFKIVLPTTTRVISFSGSVMGVEYKGGDVEGTWMADITILPSGNITWPTTV